MWFSFFGSKNFVFVPQNIDLTINYLDVAYLSVDSGVAWNFRGERIIKSNSWYWCSSDIIPYIKSLWSKKIIPILYSRCQDTSTINELISSFDTGVEISTPVFCSGFDVDDIDIIIRTSLVKTKNFASINIGLNLRPSFRSFNIGPKPKNQNILQTSLSDIGIKPNGFHENRCLLILMGQQSSGKTEFTKTLETQGWLIINEKESLTLQRGDNEKYTEFLTLLRRVTPEFGIVIDACNPRRKNRLFFIEAAKKVGVNFKVGFVSCNGYENNKYRIPSKPEILLDCYSKKFEHPEDDELWFRV